MITEDPVKIQVWFLKVSINELKKEVEQNAVLNYDQAI